MNPEEFGKFLVKRRNELNLKQADLAELMHVSAPAVSKWENGRSLPDMTSLETLANVLQLSLPELLSMKESSDCLHEKKSTSSFGSKKLLFATLSLALLFVIVLFLPLPKHIEKTYPGVFYRQGIPSDTVACSVDGWALHYLFLQDRYILSLDLSNAVSSKRTVSTLWIKEKTFVLDKDWHTASIEEQWNDGYHGMIHGYIAFSGNYDHLVVHLFPSTDELYLFSSDPSINMDILYSHVQDLLP